MSDVGRARKGKRTQIAGAFTWQLVDMKCSPAWRALSLNGRRILDRLEIEIRDHGGKDNGKLPCTFDHFSEYGIARRLVAQAIREVVALGFVAVTERGRAGNAEWRRPSVYRLTYRPTDRTEPTDDWRKIATDEEADALVAASRTPPEKTKSQAHKVNQGLGLKVNRSPVILGAESGPTVHRAESGPTSISRGDTLSVQEDAGPTQKAQASDLPHDAEPIGKASAALLRSSLVRGAAR